MLDDNKLSLLIWMQQNAEILNTDINVIHLQMANTSDSLLYVAYNKEIVHVIIRYKNDNQSKL